MATKTVHTVKLEYSIRDRVFHITPESSPGTVIAWRYQSGSEVEYLVSWSPEFSSWYMAIELSDSKVF